MPQGELLQRLLEVGEHRLSLLEQQGITHAVLSCSPGAEQLEPAKSIAVCQATNAALYELTRAHPGKGRGCCGAGAGALCEGIWLRVMAHPL